MTPTADVYIHAPKFAAGVELKGLECDLLFNDNGRLYDVRVLEAR